LLTVGFAFQVREISEGHTTVAAFQFDVMGVAIAFDACRTDNAPMPFRVTRRRIGRDANYLVRGHFSPFQEAACQFS
jgi:hypothetical protein